MTAVKKKWRDLTQKRRRKKGTYDREGKGRECVPWKRGQFCDVTKGWLRRRRKKRKKKDRAATVTSCRTSQRRSAWWVGSRTATSGKGDSLTIVFKIVFRCTDPRKGKSKYAQAKVKRGLSIGSLRVKSQSRRDQGESEKRGMQRKGWSKVRRTGKKRGD